MICPLVRDQEVDGSNPFAPTTSFRTNNLQHAKERKTAWCKTRRSAVQFDSRPTALNPPFQLVLVEIASDSSTQKACPDLSTNRSLGCPGSTEQ